RARADSSRARFAAVRAGQRPDGALRGGAESVVESFLGIEAARAAVADILATVTHPGWISRHRGIPGPTEAGH
ncbi:MAG: dephospho-CoA kinase, partial [Brevundimonas sp.]